ncbi:MAG: histone deacetylase family protein [Bauldia sp.]
MFLEHLVPGGHPERPARLQAIARRLSAPEFDGLIREGATEPPEAAITAVHPERYVESLRVGSRLDGLVQIDSDTFLAPRSFEVASRAAGAVCSAIDAVLGGRATNAFCAVRPPGHHAEPETAMGFCLFNSVAIGARHAQRAHGLSRVAIVDWDVHHGNGTQATFWTDPSVLYASTHQYPLFPMTGAESETGAGNIVNVTLKAGTAGPAFRDLFASRVLSRVEAFAPELIVISAGFDAHWRDPLAELALQAEDFAWATTAVMEVADRVAGGRIVSVLEGGYDLEGLAESAAAHVAALMAS